MDNVPILYPLKTLDKQRIVGVYRGYKIKAFAEEVVSEAAFQKCS